MKEKKKKDSGFVVKDKRLFAESDEARPQEKTQAPAAEEKPKIQESSQTTPEQVSDYPPITFTNFVLSLSTSALFHFGDFPDSEGGASQKNMPAVKQTIDILDMIHEKTKGNLNENENSLIQGILYELKMRYVKEKV